MRANIFGLLALLLAAAAATADDFLAVDVLPDGEVETTIRFRGISAKETAVSLRNRDGFKIRQLTDGKHFIQLIYEDGKIKDCEFLHDKDQISNFLNKFNVELKHLSNVTVRPLEERLDWLDFVQLRGECEKRHREIKTALDGAGRSRGRRSLEKYLIVPGTLWCGLNDAAPSYLHLGMLSRTDKCCRKHDHCKHNIPPFTTKFSYFNSGPFTISNCWCDRRGKREISDLLRIPGTKWCGKGFSATKYTHLGGFSKTDKCCRAHDTACPFWIPGFSTKYGLFNWRINTIMHCSCDERFRACLKMVDTSDANIVGKVFFNIVQTKCFVLKPKKLCTKRSWWGKCTKRKYVKHAIIRDNLSY